MNQTLDTRLNISWVFFTVIFSTLLGFDNYILEKFSFAIMCFGVIIALIIFAFTIRNLVLGKGVGDSVLVFTTAACLYCAKTTLDSKQPVVAVLFFLSSLFVGFFAWTKKRNRGAKRATAEVYITLFIVLSCSVSAVIPTIILKHLEPHSSCAAVFGFFSQLSFSTHIYPLTIAGYCGIFFGLSGLYRNLLDNRHHLPIEFARTGAMTLIFLGSMFVSYLYPRGWLIPSNAPNINTRFVMVGTSIAYVFNIIGVPLIILSIFKNREKRKNNHLFIFSIFSITGGFFQGVETAVLRHYLLGKDKFLEHLAYHTIVDTLIAICFSIGIIFSITKERRLILFSIPKQQIKSSPR
ncbi:hypothetical protein MLD52_21360 [Puniceicoccaceae bacterium K14]|nr:hypothetical protein [Puniceicoccaceae bacterium K14]